MKLFFNWVHWCIRFRTICPWNVRLVENPKRTQWRYDHDPKFRAFIDEHASKLVEEMNG